MLVLRLDPPDGKMGVQVEDRFLLGAADTVGERGSPPAFCHPNPNSRTVRQAHGQDRIHKTGLL
jgi:hypothetical protein